MSRSPDQFLTSFGLGYPEYRKKMKAAGSAELTSSGWLC
jgi:hypothetical protein